MKILMVRTQIFRGFFARRVANIVLAALLTAVPCHVALAATAPSLGTAQSFAVLAETVTNTGPTVINGDLGVSPGAIAPSGFPPGIVNGVQQIGNGVSLQAKSDARTAYNNLASQACTTTYIVPTDLGGMTLVPGVYCFASSAGLTGTVPLTLLGGPGDVWVFKTGSTLITGPDSSVVMSGGGQDCNVFWQIGSSATLDTNTQFIGNILAHTSISLNSGANVAGRLLAGMQPNGAGAVTLINNNVTPSVCSVPVPPTLVKAFDPATINAGGTSALTITLSNPNSTPVTGASLTDTLPTGVTFVGSAANNGCGGTIANDANALTLTGGSILANSSCTVTAVVTSSVVGPHDNTAALATDQGTALAGDTLTVLTPDSIAPTLSKTFSPAVINAGENSTLTITFGNTNSSAASYAPFTDTLPIGVTFVGAPTSNGCGGTFVSDANSFTLSGGSIPSGGCTVTATVTSSVPGLHLNTTGALETDKGNAPPASDTLFVNLITPIGILKSFTPDTIDAGGVTLLTITVNNPNPSIAIPVGFVDFLPSSPGQMVVATGPDPLINTCGGTLTAVPGSTSVSYAAGSLSAQSSCTVTVYVTAPVVGPYTNTLGTASAILTVFATPTLAKAFYPATINAGGPSTLTITLSNPDSTIATLTAPLIDTLPPGVVIATTPNAVTTCGSGTVSAPVGGSTVTLALGSTIPANSFCTVTVNVTAQNPGSYENSLGIGALQTNHGFNAAPAVTTLTVTPVIPVNEVPTISKTFSPSTINAGGISTVTIILTNPGDTPATIISFIDTLPSGLVVAGSGANASTTSGGTLTAIAGQSTVTLTGGSIPANGFVIIKFDVYAPVAGTYDNTLASGTLQTSNGNNIAPVVATLIVNPRPPGSPTLKKSFSPTIINAGKVSTLTITLSNPNSIVATLIAPLTDYFPSGLVVAGSGPNASTTCGGTLTAITGTAKIILTGGSIPANSSCRVKVDVTAKYKGSYNNKLPAGALQTNNGSNVSLAGATLSVYLEPRLSKSFSPAIINAGKISTLTITLSNPNSSAAATLTAPLTDTLPGGMVVAASGNFSNSCGGTLTATPGALKVTLTGGSIPAKGSCTVTVPVTARYKGSYTNKLLAGALQTNKGSNVTAASATLSVYLEPRLSKSFSPAIINEGNFSTLTITLSNPNSSAAASLTAPLTDTLPGGMVVAASGNFSNSCGGILTANAGDLMVTLTGGSIPANGSCTVAVPVTASKGSYYNNLPVGALQTNKGNNITAASATLTVQ